MIYRGTRVIPVTPDWSECRLRNRAAMRVLIATADGPRIAPFDLFVNKAGTVVAQDLMGRRIPLSKLCTFHLEPRPANLP